MSRLSEIVEILQYSPSSTTTTTTTNAEPPTVFELPIGKDEDEKVEPTSLSPTQPPSSEQSSSQPSSPLPVTFPLEIHQTHISVVALTNECAYKLKKPVNFGFLDFSTLQQRFLACVNEVLLNKRLSPYLYLSVVRVRVQERRDNSTADGKSKISSVFFAEPVDLSKFIDMKQARNNDSNNPTTIDNEAEMLLTDKEKPKYLQCKKQSAKFTSLDRERLWQSEQEYLKAQENSNNNNNNNNENNNNNFKFIDYAVKMRKIPQACLMSALVDAPLPKDEKITKLELFLSCIDRIVSSLTPFYFAQKSLVTESVLKLGSVEAIKYNVLGNFNQIEQCGFIDSESKMISSEQFQFLKSTALAFFEDYNWLFQKRVEDRFIYDAHGDLHTNNIFLCPRFVRDPWYSFKNYFEKISNASPSDILHDFVLGGIDVEVFDCIEFSERLRCHDIVCDTSFLAMDLDFRQSLSESKFPSLDTTNDDFGYKMSLYSKSGLQRRIGGVLSVRLMREMAHKFNDPNSMKLHHFYACYRAVVRGKIQAMTSQDMMQSKEDREKAAVLASQYFNLACRYSSIFDVRDVGFSAPFLIIMCGFTGSGKSFIAKRLARMLSLQYISSDEVRKTLFASNATALQSSLSRPETDHSSSGSSSNDKEENKLDSGVYSLNNRELVYNEMNKIAWSHLHAIQNDSFSPSRPFGLKELKIDMQKPSSETASSSTSASYSSASSSNVPLPCSVHNGCILDATFLSRKNRAPAYEIAMSTGAIPILLHVCVTDDTAKARIEHRAQKDKTNPSEGTWNVFVNQKKNFEEFDQLVLSSSRAFNENKLVINIDASIDRPWERAYDEIVMKRDIDMQTLRFG